jgi:hypothetical protein
MISLLFFSGPSDGWLIRLPAGAVCDINLRLNMAGVERWQPVTTTHRCMTLVEGQSTALHTTSWRFGSQP